nr:zeta toxin family protein [Candidatus Brocadia pituitae]
MVKEKKIVIIAGPNGAGKTTFATEFLPNEAGCPIFVNADLIAAGLSPFFPEHAAFRVGRLVYEEIKTHLLRSESFAFAGLKRDGLIFTTFTSSW